MLLPWKISATIAGRHTLHFLNKTGTFLLLSDCCSALLLLQRRVSNHAATKEDQKGRAARNVFQRSRIPAEEHEDEGGNKKEEILHAYLFFTQTILILSLHSWTGQVVSREVISRLLLAATAATAAATAAQRQWPAYRPVKFVMPCQCSAASTPAEQQGPLRSGRM